MLLVRKKPSESASGTTSKCLPVKRASTTTTTSALFRPGIKLLVHRAPILSGLSVSNGSGGLSTGFQRPMLQRRAYSKHAEQALSASSLGPKRRFDGMSKLLARAGKGLSFKLPNANTANQQKTSSDTEESEDEEDERAEDKPFEPLEVWKSPHQGGEAKGIPPQAYVILCVCMFEPLALLCRQKIHGNCHSTLPLFLFAHTHTHSAQEVRADEYGVESVVPVLKPAPIAMYATQSVFVPAVLARTLRPHQREGVQFMYECVMGLKDFEGNGCILADGACRAMFLIACVS
jgi:hypothetical protein